MKGPSELTKLITKALKIVSGPIISDVYISSKEVEKLNELVVRLEQESLDIRLSHYDE